MSINEVVDMMRCFFPDPPCCYNNMDELALCDWCAEHCDFPASDERISDCWKHAIKDEWWKKIEAPERQEEYI